MMGIRKNKIFRSMLFVSCVSGRSEGVDMIWEAGDVKEGQRP